MKKSQYKVAVNDINKPSFVVLTSILVPLFFICAFSFYLLTMPINDNNVSVYSSNNLEQLYVIYVPIIIAD